MPDTEYLQNKIIGATRYGQNDSAPELLDTALENARQDREILEDPCTWH